MTRALALTRALAIAGALSAACSGRAPIDLRAIPNQNVLLVTIDTLRADALGCYGGPAVTPALDRLAAEGIRFEFAHAHAVTTLTSHASILTGTYPFQHGIRDNSGYRLHANARTAATLLKQAGYVTAAFVGAFPLHSRFGLNQGFDVYDDRFGDTRAPDEFVMPERRASVVVALARQWIAARGAGGSGGSGGSGRSSRSGGSGASGRSRGSSGSGGSGGTDRSDPPKRSDLPGSLDLPASAGLPDPPGQWFVWVHLFDPHAPYRPPPPFDSQYAAQPYYGEVAAVDAALGPLLDDLRAAARPTLVIVTADHGEALGDHREQTHGLFAYESTLRIPLIVTEITAAASTVRLKPDTTAVVASAWELPPMANAAGSSGQSSGRVRLQPDPVATVSTVSARHVDILPTLMEAVGQPIPSDIPGRSLLTAAERADSSPRPSYFEAMSAMLNRGWAPLTGVLVDRDKYIDLPVAERYDLRADPAERTNLTGRSIERDRTLAAALRGFSAAPPGQRTTEDADATARLRALGYVAGSSAPKARYSEADDPKALVDVDRTVHDAVDAFTAGRAGDAVLLYQQVIARRPDMAIAYRHWAFIERQRGNVGVAIDILQRAMKAGVSDPRVAAQLGEYLTEGGRMADGVRLLESVTKDATGDLDALNALGIAYAQTGRADAARAIFERVLSINPHSSVPLENLGLLALEHGDVATARHQFERAAETDPQSSRAQAGLGTVASRAGDRRTAIDAWRRAVQLDPRNFDALYNVGITLAREGDLNGARPYLDQFLRTAPPAFYKKELDEVARLLR